MSLPRGGGAVRGIGEKFAVDAATGTGTLSIPLAASAGRAGWGPRPVLRYDSGNGHGPFGLGWRLDVASIRRATDRGLPRYVDEEESDTFLLRGSEDLVPVLDARGRRAAGAATRLGGLDYRVHRYLPRVEGSFLLIERWVRADKPAEACWRTISSDNVTSWYGRTAESRISDPHDSGRIFEWLLCLTYDDRGNVTSYRYVAEDTREVPRAQIWEANRTASAVGANRYLKRVLYGNRRPYAPTMDADAAEPALPNQWLFELVFDYGDHAGTYPSPAADRPWPVRPDPISAHRAGFEVRTYRRCRRALMFHHVPEDAAVGPNCLVRSTEFAYGDLPDQRDAHALGYSLLTAVTQRSFARDGTGTYHSRALPPVTLTYSAAAPAAVVPVSAQDLENLPVGISGAAYRWVDLDGEGLSGVLSEVGGAWHYQRNRGNAHFGPIRTLPSRPALAALDAPRPQLIDVEAEGGVDLVDLAGSPPGFQTRDGDGWSDFVAFAEMPVIDWGAPGLRFADLTGDGRADALVCEDDVVSWYASRGREGFAERRAAFTRGDEREGPRVRFDDGTGTLFLADMCGDGLAAIVRIRNGDVSYWPSVGYGRFGPRVSMGNAPRFDSDDAFDPARLRLADLDGTGPADLVYLGRTGVQLYFNRAGNVLTDAVVLDAPVATEDLPDVSLVDLFGDGTACLVWSSGLPADAERPLRYMRLLAPTTAGNATRKPHLLIGVANNLGATTEVEYTPSTAFYLDDARRGRPWVHRVPFPVQCASRVTTRDVWRHTAFTSTYTYHHGCFDRTEREARGFGRVERVDTEDYATFAQQNATSPFVTGDQRLYQPPVKTVTWYATGTAGDPDPVAESVLSTFDGPSQEPALPADLPSGLSAGEWGEALRACRGVPVREEAYEVDPDDLAPVRLHSVTQRRCRVRRLQARGPNRHAVFLRLEAESIAYEHDLALPDAGAAIAPDPRIAHVLQLRHDEYGNVQQSVTAAYGRRAAAPGDPLPAGALPAGLRAAVQSATHLAYAETRHTDDVVVRGRGARAAIRHRRLRMTSEQRSYELTNIAAPATGYFDASFLLRHQLCEDATYPARGAPAIPVGSLPYHRPGGGAGPQRRLVQHARTRYFDDDAGATPSQPLPFGRLGPRGLTYENYLLALTDQLLDAVLVRRESGAAPEQLLDWPAGPGRTARDVLDDEQVSGYLDGAGWGAAWAGQRWLRSGRTEYAADARASFFLPHGFVDPFGATTRVSYDALFFYVRERTDPLGNPVAVAEFDFRVLAARALVDANGNRDEVVFDVLGLVVATGRLGKRGAGRWEGDDTGTLDFARINPATTAVGAFCASNRLDGVQARRWLAGAGSRFVYHFGEDRDAAGRPRWGVRMPGVCTVTRERYAGTLATGQQTGIVVTLDCCDGAGQILMRKVMAEPDAGGALPRWVVSGRVVANNKGNPVLRYRPAFSDDFGFEPPAADTLVEVSVYDGVGRVTRTDFPDGTHSRTEYAPWHVVAHDRNDTVLESDWYVLRAGPPPADPLPASATPDQRAAWLTARHAATRTVSVLDSLGRAVIAVAHDRVEDPAGPLRYDGRNWRDDFHVTFTRLDAEGKPLWIRDPNGNLVIQHVTPVKPIRAADPGNVGDPEGLPPGTAPCYDVAGTLLFQHSMDAGSRWMLHDGAGRPILQWDVNDRRTDAGATVGERRLLLTRYDALHRMVEQRLAVNGAAPALVELVVYRDTAGRTAAQLDTDRRLNLIGQAVEHWDSAGRRTVRRVDLGGEVAWTTMTLPRDAAAPVADWSGDRTAALESEELHQLTERDALGRTTALLDWHAGPGGRVAVYQPRYNLRGALVAEDLTVGATRAAGMASTGGTRTTAIRELRYDAEGRHTSLELGNGTLTRYDYDPATGRLVHLYTRRRPVVPGDCAGDPTVERPTRPCGVQNLHYTYDPQGNVTQVQDDAQDRIWYANQQTEPSHDFTYDALYRLTAATGREAALPGSPPVDAESDWPLGVFPAPGVMRRYTQRFAYDRAGNLTMVRHAGGLGSWTRRYAYGYELPGDPGSNRLVRTWSGSGEWDATAPAARVVHRHDRHGNMGNVTSTPAAADLRWNWREQVRALDLQGGGTAFYTYAGDRQRVRKRIERLGGDVEERIYLGGFERYRRTVAGTVVEEVESHHLHDSTGRVLLVDDILVSRPTPAAPSRPRRTVLRYQYADLQGSTGTELDDQARIITREEFHPYGTTSYRLAASAAEAPPKRYRYTGAERDAESGFSYHGARHLSTSLGRWLSPDPVGTEGGPNLYAYAAGNPTSMTDPSGRQPVQLDPIRTRGQARMTMEEAAAAIRDTWSWEDQQFAQQARNFYHEQFRAAYREKANEGMKLVFVVWAAMGIAVIGGVAGGVAEGAIITAAGGEAAASLGVKLLASGIGGAFGASVEATLEQGLRTTIGERQLTPGEYAGRVALGGAAGATVRGAAELISAGRRILSEAGALGEELGEAAARGLTEGAREVVQGGAASGRAAAGGAIRLLGDAELIARAQALYIATVTEELRAAGRPVTQAAIDANRRFTTVAVLQGVTKEGQVVTLAAINQSDKLVVFRTVVGGEVAVDPQVFFLVGPRGGFYIGHEHAEKVLYEAAEAMGLQFMRVASSNLGCPACTNLATQYGVRHVNPRPVKVK